jgi:hypothetical protein
VPVPPVRRSHARVERAPKIGAPANSDASESVKRGVLPSGSREGYPDK